MSPPTSAGCASSGSTDGVGFTPAEPPGLPTRVDRFGDGFAYTGNNFYLTDDGWAWPES